MSYFLCVFVRKKLKQHKFTLYLAALTNNMLLQFLASDTSRAMMLLCKLINSKLTVVVRAADLPENYSVGHATQVEGDVGALRETSRMIPCFEVRDYIPGMSRKGWPVLDSYMPGLHDKAAVAGYNVSNALVKVPDTKNDPFYTDFVSKVVLPRQLLELASGTVNLDVEPKKVDLRRKRSAVDTQSQSIGQSQEQTHNSALTPSVLFNTIKNTFGGNQCSLVCVDYSDDCTKVACGFHDSVVRVFDVNAGGTGGFGRISRQIEHVRPKSQDVNHVAADGRMTRLSSFVDGPVAGGSGTADGAVVTGRTGGVYRGVVAGAGGGSAGGSMVELVGHSKPVYSVSQDAKAGLVVSASADRTLRLWNTSLAKCVAKYSTMAPCWDVAFGPFGYYFCAAGHDRTATVFCTDRPDPLRVFVGHISDVTCVRWHPNAALVVTGSDDHTCRLWDMRIQGQASVVRCFHGPCCNNISAVDISPNGALLAAGNLNSNNHAYVFDIGSGKPVGICCEEGGTKSTTHSVAFDPSSRTLVSGGDDCTIRSWDMDDLVLPSLHSSVGAHAVSLIAPSTRLQTRATPIYGLKFASIGLRSNGILFGAGPLDAERMQQEARNSALGEGLAARSAGINYAIPDALNIR